MPFLHVARIQVNQADCSGKSCNTGFLERFTFSVGDSGSWEPAITEQNTRLSRPQVSVIRCSRRLATRMERVLVIGGNAAVSNLGPPSRSRVEVGCERFVIRVASDQFLVVDSEIGAIHLQFLTESLVVFEIKLTKSTRIDALMGGTVLEAANSVNRSERKFFLFRCNHMKQNQFMARMP